MSRKEGHLAREGRGGAQKRAILRTGGGKTRRPCAERAILRTGRARGVKGVPNNGTSCAKMGVKCLRCPGKWDILHGGGVAKVCLGEGGLPGTHKVEKEGRDLVRWKVCDGFLRARSRGRTSTLCAERPILRTDGGETRRSCTKKANFAHGKKLEYFGNCYDNLIILIIFVKSNVAL